MKKIIKNFCRRCRLALPVWLYGVGSAPRKGSAPHTGSNRNRDTHRPTATARGQAQPGNTNTGRGQSGSADGRQRNHATTAQPGAADRNHAGTVCNIHPCQTDGEKYGLED